MEAIDHRIENDVVGNILQGMSAQTAGNDQQTTVPNDKAVCTKHSNQNLEKKSEPKRSRHDADQNKDGGRHEPVGTIHDVSPFTIGNTLTETWRGVRVMRLYSSIDKSHFFYVF